MKKVITTALTLSMLSIAGTAFGGWGTDSATSEEAQRVQKQQAIFAKGQPIPAMNWSLERHLLIALYQIRNREVSTHSVWRSYTGAILYDCPSMGYGLPYDTSLTNPLATTDEDQRGSRTPSTLAVVEQAEPNGIFASKNTSATWVMCTGDGGKIDPIYVESHVNVYPFPLEVDYTTNRIKKAGLSKVTITKK